MLNAADSCLTLYKTRLLKDGSQGRPELLRPDLHQLTWGNVPAWFKPEDMPILRLFLALQDSIVFAQDASQPLRDEDRGRAVAAPGLAYWPPASGFS